MGILVKSEETSNDIKENSSINVFVSFLPIRNYFRCAVEMLVFKVFCKKVAIKYSGLLIDETMIL